ncbi:uroporphyrinogen decarboxylase family protein [Pontiella agarivorans]|uniref:Uroporphyrinogen decarboxylase family protein n=1 Tax=Pontiella agarivorans TaxID=3038953 RepID=A0ABU5N0J8_9BACT|nr:uroporphyrinogen decarboxylase family protein [Pontiella agarivorans]MDZ8119975.1 uroporphyrinogen decarboxylase family protein [Pontiella agarivorans]
MTGKQILLDAIAGRETSRPAWLPFVGCHGGFLIGKTATEYLTSADLLVEGLKKAKSLYKPDGLPVMFDLQIEAEILGCDLHWADEVPPAVTTHPLAMGKTLADLPELDETKGRFPIVVEALKTLKNEIGEDTALYGLICGPFTLALHLLGNDIFLDMYDDEDAVIEVISYCAEICKKSADIYLDHGADVIAVVDPMTSQISPDHFEQFVTPAMNAVYDHIRERGGISSIFVCGDVTRNLEVMTQTTADNISVDEQIDMVHLRELCEAQGKSFGGNIKLTAVLLLGDEEDSKMEVLDIMEKSGNKGFILAPGCDLPYAVPIKNLQAVADMVHDEYARETAKSLQAKEMDSFDDVEVPDYQAADGVILDVITLDSTSCAPCQYMMEAVKKAAEKTTAKCYINEHKIKVREGIGMMVKLGVKNLPTICINGEPKFASIIPDITTLVNAIDEAAK